MNRAIAAGEWRGRVVLVGMADMRVSNDPCEELVTYALGSCLGIAVYDPVAVVGGLLHVMLPDSSIQPELGRGNPSMFVDTGVPRLFREAYALGAEKSRMIVKVAGGATSKMGREEGGFRIGERNVIALRRLLWKNSVLIAASDLGGLVSRTMSLDIGTGEVLLRMGGSGAKRAL